MEACGSAHYWARKLIELGHDARLIARGRGGIDMGAGLAVSDQRIERDPGQQGRQPLALSPHGVDDLGPNFPDRCRSEPTGDRRSTARRVPTHSDRPARSCR